MSIPFSRIRIWVQSSTKDRSDFLRELANANACQPEKWSRFTPFLDSTAVTSVFVVTLVEFDSNRAEANPNINCWLEHTIGSTGFSFVPWSLVIVFKVSFSSERNFFRRLTTTMQDQLVQHRFDKVLRGHSSDSYKGRIFDARRTGAITMVIENQLDHYSLGERSLKLFSTLDNFFLPVGVIQQSQDFQFLILLWQIFRSTLQMSCTNG